MSKNLRCWHFWRFREHLNGICWHCVVKWSKQTSERIRIEQGIEAMADIEELERKISAQKETIKALLDHLGLDALSFEGGTVIRKGAHPGPGPRNYEFTVGSGGMNMWQEMLEDEARKAAEKARSTARALGIDWDGIEDSGTRYLILDDNRGTLCTDVTEAINHGWLPAGGPYVPPDQDLSIPHQAVFRPLGMTD